MSVIVLAVIAVFIARDPNSSVFEIVSLAWAGFGATFGPIVLFSLFWKRSNKEGALAGMITGGVMIFVWKYLIRPIGSAFNIYELLPAFLLACVVNVVVSLINKAPFVFIIFADHLLELCQVPQPLKRHYQITCSILLICHYQKSIYHLN